MFTKPDRKSARLRRHRRVRQRIRGTAERPRLCVHRSLRHIVVQLIDDVRGVTLASASTHEPEIRKQITGTTMSIAAGTVVGRLIAERGRALSIAVVVFDRGGYLYHGRVKALADAARTAGLEF